MDEPVRPDPEPSPAEPAHLLAAAPIARQPSPPIAAPDVGHVARHRPRLLHVEQAPDRPAAHRASPCSSRLRSSCSWSSTSADRRSGRSSSASSSRTCSMRRSSGWRGSAFHAGSRCCSSTRSSWSSSRRPSWWSCGRSARACDVHRGVPDRSRPRSRTCTPTSTCPRRSDEAIDGWLADLGQGVGGLNPGDLLPVVTGHRRHRRLDRRLHHHPGLGVLPDQGPPGADGCRRAIDARRVAARRAGDERASCSGCSASGCAASSSSA